jgi:hypothetical protein
MPFVDALIWFPCFSNALPRKGKPFRRFLRTSFGLNSNSDRRSMKKFTLYTCGLVICAVLVACGGGGGQGAVAGGGGVPVGGGVPGGGGGGNVPLGPQWQGVQALETTTDNAEAADVSINADGVAYAVWTRSNGFNKTVVMSSRYSGGQWGIAKELPTAVPVGLIAESPQVVVHANGRATAIWVQSNKVDQAVLMGATTDADGNWLSLPEISNVVGLDEISELDLVPDGQDTAQAIWFFQFVVNVSHFDGTQFQAAQKISGAGNDHAYGSSLSANGNDLLAVWIEGDPNNIDKKMVFARSFRKNGGWSPDAITLSSAPSEGVFKPRVALATNGKAVAIWEELNGNTVELVARIATDAAGLQWDDEKRLASGTTLTVELEPFVSIDPQGKAVVAWWQDSFPNNSKLDLVATRFDGTVWKTSTIVEAMELGAWVRVGMNDAGDAQAVWVQSELGQKLKTSRMDAITGKWAVPERVDKETVGRPIAPVFAVNAKGQAVAAWESSAGFPNAIAANILK